MEKESIIFCQAPLKIASVLNCYKVERSKNRRIAIIAMNSTNMMKFLNSLNLEADVFFFPYPKGIGHKYLLNSCVKKGVAQQLTQLSTIGYKFTETTNIFFTDTCDNWIIGLYLKRLAKCNISKIQDKLDILKGLDSIKNRTNIKMSMRIQELLMKFVYGFPWIYTKIDHWTLKVDLSQLQYRLIDYSDMNICNEYMISAPYKGGKTILLFTEPYRNHFQPQEDYEKLNIDIIKKLQNKGYKVGVKGHPRIGCNANALKLADFEIPSYVPAEFLDLKCYDFVIGFVSSSLCSASSQIKSYSILPMCNIIDNEEAKYWYDYLCKLSNNKIIFVDNINKL